MTRNAKVVCTLCPASDGPEMTYYAAIAARELEVPRIGGVSLPDVETGTEVTVDEERGVVYRDPLTTEER